MTRLEELLREREKRRKPKRRQPEKVLAEMLPAAPARIPLAAAEIKKAPAAPVNPQDPLEIWKAKRARAMKRGLSAGEIANMIEGLTPDGFDKEGRKISFVETGEPYNFDSRPVRLSERLKDG